MASQTRLYLREWREREGMTQLEIARVLKIARASVSELESGRAQSVKFAHLDRLAKVFGCEPEALLKAPRD